MPKAKRDSQARRRRSVAMRKTADPVAGAVLVTGAGGLLGARLVERLLESGRSVTQLRSVRGGIR